MNRPIHYVCAVVACFCLTLNAGAQSFFDMSLKGGYGVTAFANKNIYKNKQVVPKISTGYCYGATLGFNINLKHEIQVEGLFTLLRQDVTMISDSNIDVQLKKTMTLKTIDIPLLYRVNSDEGGYVEIGPQFTMVNAASESIQGTGAVKTKKNFVPDYYGLVFGFGSNMLGSENVTFSLGARFTYSFKDVISDAGGRGSKISYPLNDAEYVAETAYAPTHPLSLMLVGELSFDLGYFVRNKCNKRMTFLSF